MKDTGKVQENKKAKSKDKPSSKKEAMIGGCNCIFNYYVGCFG